MNSPFLSLNRMLNVILIISVNDQSYILIVLPLLIHVCYFTLVNPCFIYFIIMIIILYRSPFKPAPLNWTFCINIVNK